MSTDSRCVQVSSDVVYSATVLSTLALGIRVFGFPAQTVCYAALLLGAAAGLLPFGLHYVRAQFAPIRWSALRRYAPIWHGQARWALLGVFTTEATANAHVYLITFFQGSEAFAPIAASALLMRPVNVAQNALSDFERPQMARLIGQRNWSDLRRSVTWFKRALGAIWLGSVVFSLVLFLTEPRVLFPARYDLRQVATAAALWTAVAALRLWQTPPSVMLQAAGEFRPLALASVWSSIVCAASVCVLILTTSALWSIAGLIVGAAIFLNWTQLAAGRWIGQRADEQSIA